MRFEKKKKKHQSRDSGNKKLKNSKQKKKKNRKREVGIKETRNSK